MANFILRRFDEVRTCIAFFSRLPVLATGLLSYPTAQEISLADHSKLFSNSFWATPIAGGLLGLISVALVWLVGWLLPTLPHSILAILALTLLAGMTGGLHEDGLADLADACGGSTKDRRLEIMKDSRIGSFGVVSLILWFLTAYVCLSALDLTGPQAWLIFFASMASRATLPLAIWMMPSATTSGLGESAKTGADRPQLLAIVALAIGLVPALAFGLWPAVVGMILGQALALGLSFRLVEGATGDSFGAAQKMGELGFYIGAVTIAHRIWMSP